MYLNINIVNDLIFLKLILLIECLFVIYVVSGQNVILLFSFYGFNGAIVLSATIVAEDMKLKFMTLLLRHFMCSHFYQSIILSYKHAMSIYIELNKSCM